VCQPWDYDFLDRPVPTYEGDEPLRGPEENMRFFWLRRDEVLARLDGGWRRQIWQPTTELWVDWDFDLAGEASELSFDEARELVAHRFADGVDPLAPWVLMRPAGAPPPTRSAPASQSAEDTEAERRRELADVERCLAERRAPIAPCASPARVWALQEAGFELEETSPIPTGTHFFYRHAMTGAILTFDFTDHAIQNIDWEPRP
jgi:hypothetical protein